MSVETYNNAKFTPNSQPLVVESISEKILDNVYFQDEVFVGKSYFRCRIGTLSHQAYKTSIRIASNNFFFSAYIIGGFDVYLTTFTPISEIIKQVGNPVMIVFNVTFLDFSTLGVSVNIDFTKNTVSLLSSGRFPDGGERILLTSIGDSDSSGGSFSGDTGVTWPSPRISTLFLETDLTKLGIHNQYMFPGIKIGNPNESAYNLSDKFLGKPSSLGSFKFFKSASDYVNIDFVSPRSYFTEEYTRIFYICAATISKKQTGPSGEATNPLYNRSSNEILQVPIRTPTPEDQSLGHLGIFDESNRPVITSMWTGQGDILWQRIGYRLSSKLAFQLDPEGYVAVVMFYKKGSSIKLNWLNDQLFDPSEELGISDIALIKFEKFISPGVGGPGPRIPSPTPTSSPTPVPSTTPTITPTFTPSPTKKVIIPYIKVTPTPSPSLPIVESYDAEIKTKIKTLITSNHVAPMIDKGKLSFTLVHNIINTMSDYKSEFSPSGGEAFCRYILKPVKLNTDITASRLSIFFAASVPNECFIRVYYRTLNSTEDTELDINQKRWRYVGDTGSIKTTRTEFRDFEYVIETIDYDNDPSIFEFDQFSIKLVLESTNDAIVPFVKDFRVIALS